MTVLEPQTELSLKIDEETSITAISPRLKELTERKCSVEELQAALVHLIHCYNKQGKRMEAEIHRISRASRKSPGQQLRDMLDTPYTI